MAKLENDKWSVASTVMSSCIQGDYLSMPQAISIAEEKVAYLLGKLLKISYSESSDDLGITAMVAHYRGIQVLSQKKTAFYSTGEVRDETYRNYPPYFHEALLRCYEASQNNSHYTLNSIITKLATDLEGHIVLMSLLEDDGSLSIELKLKNDTTTVSINKSICDSLFGINNENSKANPLKEMSKRLIKKEELPKLLKRIKESHHLKEFLFSEFEDKDFYSKDKRLHALKACSLIKKIESRINYNIEKLIQPVEINFEDSNKNDSLVNFCKGLKSTLQAAVHSVVVRHWQSDSEVENLKNLHNKLLLAGDEKYCTHEYQIFDSYFPILRMLQGILLFHKCYGNFLCCKAEAKIINKRVGSASWLTIHQQKPANISSLDQLHSFIGNKADNVISEILGLAATKHGNNTENQELQGVFIDRKAKDIVEDKICKRTNIPSSHLCAFVRLAEMFRPQAVHEGNPLEMAIVLGTPFHLNSFFETKTIIKDYAGNEYIDGPTLGKMCLELLPLGTSAVNVEDFLGREESNDDLIKNLINKYLSLCCGRIKGKVADLIGPDNILFVDYTNKVPAVSHVVSIRHSTGLREYTSLRKLTNDRNCNDMLIIRVFGRRRIELLHGGNCLLSWDDNEARWQAPAAWDENNLKKTISISFWGKEDLEQNIDDAISTLCHTIMEISDASGEGASFVLAPETIDNYIGNLTEDQKWDTGGKEKLVDFSSLQLRKLAIQDGGTVVNLQHLTVSFRKLFRPFNESEAKPFDIFSYKVKDDRLCDKWNKINDPYKWDNWPSVLHWGTRHQSSLGMSACLPNTLCICISEDGPIQVFESGRAIEDVDTPIIINPIKLIKSESSSKSGGGNKK